MVSRAPERAPPGALFDCLYKYQYYCRLYLILHSRQYPGKPAIATAALNTLVSSDDGRIMRLINRLAYCLAAAIPVAILAGCSGASSSGGGPLETSTIVIDAVPTADAAGLYIAYDEGLFAKQGLTVKIARSTAASTGWATCKPARPSSSRVTTSRSSWPRSRASSRRQTRRIRPSRLPAKPIDMRIIADSSQMLPGNQALYVLPNSALQDGGGPGQGPRDDRHQLAQQHRPGAARLAVRGGRTRARVDQAGSAAGLSAHARPTWPSTRSTRPGCRSRSAPRPSRSTGRCSWPTSTRARCRTSPSARSSATLSGCSTHPNTVAAFLRAFDQGQQIADTDRVAVEQALVPTPACRSSSPRR